MRLTKLEINGFKSFARKTELQFSPGITAVIGPNGSGKSNISDAVRWVLGEQSARALRGSKMEDVIFAGTEQKKAQAYCEVSLTFDNADQKLPVPFSEVAVTRRAYRSGDSEYCLNGNPCRLRDIQDMFRDTGIGKDGYSNISQGKVDEILSNKSNDRRVALEEAAGVMRYRVRKEEAGRKLDNTQKNLERIEDILEELSDRLGPLEEQSATARRYLKLRDELKDYEVNLFLYQYERYNERLSAIVQAMEQMQQEQSVAEATEQTLLAECATLEEQVRALDTALTEHQNALLSMLSGVEAHVGESNVLLERREHGKQEIERVKREREAAKTRCETLESALAQMQAGDAEEAAIQRLDAEIETSNANLCDWDQQVTAAEALVEKLKNDIMEALNRLSDAKSSLSRYEAMTTAFENRLDAIAQEAERHQTVQDTLERERISAQEEYDEKERLHQNAVNDFASAQQNRAKLQAESQRVREEHHALEQKNGALQSRQHVLREMAKSREGYYASVKNLMRDTSRDAKLSSAVIGVVAELIRVPKEYEQAITMVLGSSMQNIVTPTAEDAKYVIEYLRRNDYGRATLLPLSILRQNRLRREEEAYLDTPGCIGVASRLVDADQRISGAIEFLLGRTVIVRDMDSGIALKKRSGGAFHIATLEGDIISTGGSMSGGSRQKQAFSLLGRERELAEIGETLQKYEKELHRLEADCTEKEKQLLLSDVQIDAFRDAQQKLQIEVATQKEKLEIIRRDQETAIEKQKALDEETQQIRENLAEIEHEKQTASSLQNDIESGNATTKEDVFCAQKALLELREQREKSNTALTEQRVRRMALEKERDAVTQEQNRLEKEKQAAMALVTESENTLSSLNAQMDAVNAAIEKMQQNISGEQADVTAQKDAQKALEEERTRLSSTLSELRNQRENAIASSRELSDRLHKQEMQKSRMEMELTGMQDHIWEEYELTYENALPLRHEIAIGSTNSRIAEIKTEIRELGDVNLASIEDYKSVYERHTALSAQWEDLCHAKADLETLIVELTQTMQTEFNKKFAIIQENFTEVFSKLFGGGHADLRLADENDVLNCDIDIIAQPPGKKLQLLSLLSGGERALTAIALLFAMLQLKAPAFCVLDEIESSLDEVNVSRFAGFLKTYSSETQFIIITHRKGSMEVCNSLYGVSMEEKGISKIVSAKFGEAG